MRRPHFFLHGFRSMLPITTGVIPFGAVMGTVCANAQLSFFQAVSMNVLVFGGASQLAAVDLMTQHATGLVVVVTGLIINLRFLLYSAALSPVVQNSKVSTKIVCAYFLTDQNYAVMSAHQDQFKTSTDAIQFFIGASVCMAFAWHLSVMAGFAFGDFAPSTFSLDFAVPLSFVALVVPTLKNRKYVFVAVFSSIVSLLLQPISYKIGLILTAIASIALAYVITRRKAAP